MRAPLTRIVKDVGKLEEKEESIPSDVKKIRRLKEVAKEHDRDFEERHVEVLNVDMASPSPHFSPEPSSSLNPPDTLPCLDSESLLPTVDLPATSSACLLTTITNAYVANSSNTSVSQSNARDSLLHDTCNSLGYVGNSNISLWLLKFMT